MDMAWGYINKIEDEKKSLQLGGWGRGLRWFHSIGYRVGYPVDFEAVAETVIGMSGPITAKENGGSSKATKVEKAGVDPTRADSPAPR